MSARPSSAPRNEETRSAIAPSASHASATSASMSTKSLLRTSSGSYPYPRSHTTVMVLPSSRPFEAESSETKKTLIPMRRPPLNRAIPTIPESKSNESIMTQTSERVEQLPSPSDDRCVIIENRMADSISRISNKKTMLPRLSSSSKPTSCSARSATGQKQRAETPRSPLMSVAHSVRSKLSKLGRLGRSADSAGSSSSIKGSRSMTSMRPTLSRSNDADSKMAKSHSMETSSSKDQKVAAGPSVTSPAGGCDVSSLPPAAPEMPQMAESRPKSPSSPSLEIEENVKKQVAIVRSTYRHEQTSIVLRDPTSTTSTILAIEETIAAPNAETTKPPLTLALNKYNGNEARRDSLDDRAEANDLEHDDAAVDELASDLLEEADDEIPMDVGVTPMSESSYLVLQEIGQPGSDPITLRRLKQPLPPDISLKEEIFTIRAEPDRKAIIVSETSTVVLQAEDDGELLKLKRISDESVCDEEWNISKAVNDAALACIAQPRTQSVDSQPSELFVTPADCTEIEPIHLRKINDMLNVTNKKDQKTQQIDTKKEDISAMFKHVATFCMGQPKTESITTSETSTLYLLPLGDEANEPVRLKQIRADGTEANITETPHHVQKVLKEVATFCMNQPRTKSICLSDSSSVHLLPIGGCAEESIRVHKVHEEVPSPVNQERDILREVAVFCWAHPRRDSIAGSDISSLCLMPLTGQSEERVHLRKAASQQLEIEPVRELSSPDDVAKILHDITTCCVGAPQTQSVAMSEVSSMYIAAADEHADEPLHLRHLKSNYESTTHKHVNKKAEKCETKSKRDFATFCVGKPDVESLQLSETSTLFLQPIGEEDAEPLRLKRISQKNQMAAPLMKEIRPFGLSTSALTIDATSMSEASAVHYMDVGRENEEANMLRLRMVKDALEKHIKMKTLEECPQSRAKEELALQAQQLSESESSTLLIVPIDDIESEAMKLRRIPQLGIYDAKKEDIASPCSSHEPISIDSNAENIAPMIKKEPPPVFHVPAPPPCNYEHKGTSPFKKAPLKLEKHCIVPMQPEKSAKSKSSSKLRASLSMREEKESHQKQPRTPLTARSLKNFLLKKDKIKVTKPLPTSATMPLSPRANLHLGIRPNAPLAESESTVIENSPHVELPPKCFGQWSGSPRGRRRTIDRPPSRLVLFDSNGNTKRDRDVSNTSVRSTQEPGLIDDEIRDQPMLMGDSFSTSTSMDQIASKAMVRSSFEPDVSTIMSIDRSTLDEQNNEHRRSIHEASANSSFSPKLHSPGCTHDLKCENFEKQIEETIVEMEMMKAQLLALHDAILNGMATSPLQEKHGTEICCKFAVENDVLRRLLSEKNQMIQQLREQLAVPNSP